MKGLTSDAILYYIDNPVDFVEDIIGAKPDVNQKAILNSLAKYPMTSVRSGHGIGKSAVEAWAVIWFICTRPYPKIPCTAPTQHQLYDILWAEISKWLRSNPALQREITWTQERVYMNGAKEEWFAVARTANTPDALQGFHSESMLFIIDEASGVDDEVFEPVLGALSTEGARLLMCGNPTQLTGFFYDSHHKNRTQYHTIHVDDRDAFQYVEAFFQEPNISNPDDICKIMTAAAAAGGLTPNKAKEILYKYLGEASDDYEEEWGNVPLTITQSQNSGGFDLGGLTMALEGQIKKAEGQGDNDQVVAVMKEVRGLLLDLKAQQEEDEP